MNKLLVFVCILVIIAVLLCCYAVYHYEETRNEVPLVTLQELVANKPQYQGMWIRVKGFLKENLDEEIRNSYIFVLMPTPRGDNSYAWTPIIIPVVEKYRVYSLTDGNYTIALLSETNLDEYLGTEVIVRGEVDGVKTIGGVTLDYVIKTELIANP